MDKKQVQEAIGRVDTLLSKARFTEPILNREDHIILVNDIKLIQQCCMGYFEEREAMKAMPEKKDGGTNVKSKRPKPCNKNCKGSGNSV